MNIKPLMDRVVIKPFEKERATKSGIVIPETATGDAPQQGEVIAVGPGAISEKTGKLVPLEVKVGDIVLFGRYSGDEIIQKDENLQPIVYKVMHYDSLLGIVK